MAVKSVAIEHWPSKKRNEVTAWLTTTFGPSSTASWYTDVQPLIEDLVMSEEIYFWFASRFRDD